MARYDRITSVLWFFVGVYVSLKSLQIGPGTISNPGPGFIFLISGILLCLFSVIVLITAFRQAPRETVPAIAWAEIRWQKLIALVAVLFIFAYAFERIGFLIGVLLMMVYLFKGIEFQKWPIALASAVITTIAAYFIFVVILGCQLPKGLLPL